MNPSGCLHIVSRLARTNSVHVYYALHTVRRGWEVQSWQCHIVTVPETGGVKYVVYIMISVKATAQILIAASALPVYQGLPAGQRFMLSYT